MLGYLSFVIDYFAPIFLIASPVTSYADQIVSIHRNKSSDGFAIDIPLIMLLASILKVFYWFGEYYDKSLLLQAILTLIVQSILLKVAVDNKPSSSSVATQPFQNFSAETLMNTILEGKRPYNFWRWNNTRPYFQFLAYFAAALLAVHVLLPFISGSPTYIALLGYVGLAIEAILPIPQILKNHNARSCKGFRLSVIINWLAGDSMKMSYFFLSSEIIPWPFRLCGMFQAACDTYLGLQFYMYGDGSRLVMPSRPAIGSRQPSSRAVEMRDVGKTSVLG